MAKKISPLFKPKPRTLQNGASYSLAEYVSIPSVIEGMKAFNREPTAAELKETPPWTEEEWKKAKLVRGGIRKSKTILNLDLDPDIVDWLKSFGKGYSSHANRILRLAMLSAQAQPRGKSPSKTEGDHGSLSYPARFVRESEGGYSVSFPDFPEAHTQGENRKEAFRMAVDCLRTVLSWRLDEKRDIPEPSAAKRGEVNIPISL